MTKHIAAVVAAVAVIGGSVAAWAADAKPGKGDQKVKPYTLKICIVSDEKLGEMGDPYVFTNDFRQIKLCCKSCLKDFQKTPAKFMKKLETEEAKAKKKKE